jgi:hypothetical protein
MGVVEPFKIKLPLLDIPISSKRVVLMGFFVVLELPGKAKFKALGLTSVDTIIKNINKMKIMSVIDDIPISPLISRLSLKRMVYI